MNTNRGTDKAINNLLHLYTISVPPTEINHKISYPKWRWCFVFSTTVHMRKPRLSEMVSG